MLPVPWRQGIHSSWMKGLAEELDDVAALIAMLAMGGIVAVTVGKGIVV